MLDRIKNLWRRWTGQEPRVNPPLAPPKRDYPPTFGEWPDPSAPAGQEIFDPALAHYSRAFRRGDPVLPPEDTLRWQEARRRAMRHVLAAVLGSPISSQLVARGSLTMKAILGKNGREPGDIDWIVVPPSLQFETPPAVALLDGVIAAVTSAPVENDIIIDHAAIARSDIWTYERAPGHRIVFPWSLPDLPAGLIQMDFVFSEPLLNGTQQLELSLPGGPPLSLCAATDAESLAWKLLWLHTDIWIQGKDLYDAVLLAERVRVPGALLYQVFLNAGEWREDMMANGFPFFRHALAYDPGDYGWIDWPNFQLECPWVEGDAKTWAFRLWDALGNTADEARAHAASLPPGR